MAKLTEVRHSGMKLPFPSEITSRPFGVAPGGLPIESWKLTGVGGLQLEAIPYGATITRLVVPDKAGRLDDVVLGFNSLEDYLRGSAYFGAAIGRVAGRIGGGSFTVDGMSYELVRNDGPNHLHGGILGFDKKIWHLEATRNDQGEPSLVFTYTSPNGEEGYPGSVHVRLTYTVTDDNKLIVDVQAKSDQSTPFNFTQHSYFNLAGEGSGAITDHVLQIFADDFVPVDDTMALSGSLVPVTGQRNDFRRPRSLREAIPVLSGRHGDLYRIQPPPGGAETGLRMAARLVHPESGRVLEISTTEEYLQFYTGVAIDGTISGKSGRSYGAHAGLCLECEGYPDGANQPALGNIVLRPGGTKRSTTIYNFSIDTQEGCL